MRSMGPGSLYCAKSDSSASFVLPPPSRQAMPLVTGIMPHPRRPGRFGVSVDGVETATVGIEGVERLGLRVGADVTPRLLTALADETAAVAVRKLIQRTVRRAGARTRATWRWPSSGSRPWGR